MASIKYSDVRRGMVIAGEGGQLFAVLDRELKTPGNLPSKLTLKLKNLKTGFVNDTRVHPDDKVEQAFLERREMQYIYKDGADFVFMDSETFDQFPLPADMVAEVMQYLKEGNKAQVLFHEGKALSLDLPPTVELQVIDTEPSLKGATANVLYKPATLETGLKTNVPPFVSVGETIVVDTRTGEYVSRAKA